MHERLRPHDEVAHDAYPTGAELPAIEGLALRHFRPATDLPGMNGVANRARQADGVTHVTSDEEFAAYYRALPHSDTAADLVIVTVHDTVVGYGRVTSERLRAGDRAWTHQVVGFVDPEWRRRGIGTALQATLEGRAREIAVGEGDGSPIRLRVEAEDAATSVLPLLRRFAYEPVRYWFNMLRPTLDDVPDRPLPAGLDVRAVRPEQLEAIWAAEVEAVADHWGNSEVTDEEYQEFLRGATPEATSLWQVAWDGDEVAGQVRSYINDELNDRDGITRGFVEYITVRKPWRRRGLASALIATSLPLLKARGMTEAMLTVDSENATGALGLYRAMGFEVISRATTWEKPVVEVDPARA